MTRGLSKAQSHRLCVGPAACKSTNIQSPLDATPYSVLISLRVLQGQRRSCEPLSLYPISHIFELTSVIPRDAASAQAACSTSACPKCAPSRASRPACPRSATSSSHGASATTSTRAALASKSPSLQLSCACAPFSLALADRRPAITAGRTR